MKEYMLISEQGLDSLLVHSQMEQILQNDIILYNVYTILCLWIKELKIYILLKIKLFHFCNYELFLQGSVLTACRELY